MFSWGKTILYYAFPYVLKSNFILPIYLQYKRFVCNFILKETKAQGDKMISQSTWNSNVNSYHLKGSFFCGQSPVFVFVFF